MLSYRHAFHAGNPADVLKHTCLMLLIKALQLKEKGFQYIDTHAGAGVYDLKGPSALKNAEHAKGAERLLTWAGHQTARTANTAHEALMRYAELLQQFQQEQARLIGLEASASLRWYPGSPAIARSLLRPQDRLCLVELQNQEHQQLKQLFSNQDQFSLHHRDAYEALPALVPPQLKRALVLIDPSYELKDEGQRLQTAVIQAVKKFPQGVYAIWYPLIEGINPIARLKQQNELRGIEILDLRYMLPAAARLGRMNGNGMLLLNPPWHARPALEGLCEALDQVFTQTWGSTG